MPSWILREEQSSYYANNCFQNKCVYSLYKDPMTESILIPKKKTKKRAIFNDMTTSRHRHKLANIPYEV